MTARFLITVHRQAGPGQPAHEERFSLSCPPQTTVAQALQHLAADPVTLDGATVSPVLWDDRCSAPVCGGCTMLINGWPRTACATPLSALEQPVVLQPLPGFPVVADLWVDRTPLHDALLAARAWVPISDAAAAVSAVRMSQEQASGQQQAHRCTECGACQAVCPSVGPHYRGAAVMHALHALLRHPATPSPSSPLLSVVLDAQGIAGCGNARNCAAACPQGLPLTQDLAELQGRASGALLRQWLGR